MNESKTSAERPELAYRIAARVAAVAAVFSIVAAALLCYDFSRRTMKDPFDAAPLKSLRELLDQQPANETLLEQYRATDERLRQEYFRQRAFVAVGAGLLGLGLLVMLAAAKTAARLRRKLPAPQPVAVPQDWESRWKPWAIAAVAAVAALLAGLDVALSALRPSWLPSEEEVAALETTPRTAPTPIPPMQSGGFPTVSHAKLPAPRSVPPAPYAASDDEISHAWSRFRGPDGSGISPYTDVPDTWDCVARKNVLWRADVPLPGNSSPIVCGQRVFLTGATEKTRQVLCFDAKTGALVWQKEVPSTAASRGELKVMNDTGFAAPTPATDGRRVFAIFPNGDLAAFDFAGEPIWFKSLGIPENSYGHAASLLVYRETLLVPWDQGKSGAGRSKLLALDAATGEIAWQKSRPVNASWTTPILIRHAGADQVITLACPWIIAHDPRDGSELWRAGGPKGKAVLTGDPGPSPVFADGVVVAVANDQSPILAVRPDGKGDVTLTHVLWQGEDNRPDLCSPLATSTQVYFLDASGMLTAYDTHKGDKLWEKDLGDFTKAPGESSGRFLAKASPSMAGKLLYVINFEDGKGLVLEPGNDGCKKVGTTDLGEKCTASPAFQPGRIYLRGEKHLFCIGK
jgi:outer membrane protein assembly factor BamB